MCGHGEQIGNSIVRNELAAKSLIYQPWPWSQVRPRCRMRSFRGFHKDFFLKKKSLEFALLLAYFLTHTCRPPLLSHQCQL